MLLWSSARTNMYTREETLEYAWQGDPEKSLPASGRGCEAPAVTGQMFRKSFRADKRLLQQWDNAEETKRPLPGRRSGTFLGWSSFSPISLPYSNDTKVEMPGKSHLSRKKGLEKHNQEEDISGDVLSSSLHYLSRKKKKSQNISWLCNKVFIYGDSEPGI